MKNKMVWMISMVLLLSSMLMTSAYANHCQDSDKWCRTFNNASTTTTWEIDVNSIHGNINFCSPSMDNCKISCKNCSIILAPRMTYTVEYSATFADDYDENETEYGFHRPGIDPVPTGKSCYREYAKHVILGSDTEPGLRPDGKHGALEIYGSSGSYVTLHDSDAPSGQGVPAGGHDCGTFG